jgi:hypothetical protein
VRLVRNTNYLKLGPDDVILQYAPVSFDASTFEIWGALLNGGKLVVYEGAGGSAGASLEDLGQVLKREAVTTLWLTAGLFHLMVEERLDDLRGVKQLLAGGDVLQVGAVKRVVEELKGCELINGYGPTEGTTFTCCYAVGGGSGVGTTVPIGRAISNTQVYVLDAGLREVAVGVAGELCIGGDGVARGYWKRPELTAEKFVPNPYAEEEGDRLYRTGDRVRYREDGVLEFLGRVDTQVKVRGYRVELGEVEEALRGCAGVKECVVAVKGESAGEKRLVGYLVWDDGVRSFQSTDLRKELKALLPEYMLPNALVRVGGLPLNANGKVDRQALSEPEEWQAGLELGHVAPRTVVEEMLAEIWAEVLELEKVGIHDNFFELGGHSLLATLVMSRVQRAFRLEMPVRYLFESPTIALLSKQIGIVMRGEKSGTLQLPIRRAPRHERLPLSYAQERLYFLDQFQPGSSFYNVPGAVRIEGDLDIHALKRSLREIVRRHEVLHTRFVMKDGEPAQEIDVAIEVALPLMDLSSLEEVERTRQVREFASLEGRSPFDLSRGQIGRAHV